MYIEKNKHSAWHWRGIAWKACKWERLTIGHRRSHATVVGSSVPGTLAHLSSPSSFPRSLKKMSQNTKKARDIPQDAIQVLIEREDWTPLLPLRRSSLAPPGSDSTSGARRQRTATTLHASIDVPDTLIASLSSTTMGMLPCFVPTFQSWTDNS